MSRASWTAIEPTRGFTLIEVIGALVVFSVGVLMVIQLSGALGAQMRYAGASSELVILGNEKLDSLERISAGVITAGTTTDTITVGGRSYQRTVVVTTLTPVLARVVVSLSPIGGTGPSYSVTSYRSAPW